MVGGVIESTPLSHRHRLRAATADAHGRVDALAADATRSAAGYAAYLRGMHRFLGAGEQALHGDASAAGIRARRLWLEVDLDALGLAPVAGGPVQSPLQADAERLGWAYVIAGASLGAKVLLRGAAALGYDRGHGARFLAGHADGDAWPTLLDRLEAAALSNDDQDRMCAAARAAFDAEVARSQSSGTAIDATTANAVRHRLIARELLWQKVRASGACGAPAACDDAARDALIEAYVNRRVPVVEVTARKASGANAWTSARLARGLCQASNPASFISRSACRATSSAVP